MASAHRSREFTLDRSSALATLRGLKCGTCASVSTPCCPVPVNLTISPETKEAPVPTSPRTPAEPRLTSRPLTTSSVTEPANVPTPSNPALMAWAPRPDALMPILLASVPPAGPAKAPVPPETVPPAIEPAKSHPFFICQLLSASYPPPPPTPPTEPFTPIRIVHAAPAEAAPEAAVLASIAAPPPAAPIAPPTSASTPTLPQSTEPV